MNVQKTILLGALIIAASLFLTTNRSVAAHGSSGPFQIMHHSNTQANAGVFRLDTATGEVSYCYLSGVRTDEASRVVCSSPVR